LEISQSVWKSLWTCRETDKYLNLDKAQKNNLVISVT
jgi:hypothetical protein